MMVAWGRCVGMTVGLTIALITAAPASAALPPLQHLKPGQPGDAKQDVPVNVVFVGLEPGSSATGIDTGRLLAPQLSQNKVLDRTTRFHEREGSYDKTLEPSAIGITYDYDYRTVFAGDQFEDAFFEYLTSIAIGPIPRGTIYQQAYSADPLAAQQIPASLLIDATAAERWLAENAGPQLGVDTTRPTVFFVNWFGRPDFAFHTYGFLGVRPGFPFPIGRTHDGQMVAWGGSPPDVPYGGLGRQARVWFYDVSAGPDFATANWLLGPPDFNGDGQTDERIAPIWEYGTNHWYRPFDDLTADLAKLLRFVAVDALFGSSPVYDPALSEPLLSDRVELDLNLFAGRSDRGPASTMRIADLPAILGRLDPTRQFGVDPQIRPLSGAVSDAFDCQQSSYTAQASRASATSRGSMTTRPPGGTTASSTTSTCSSARIETRTSTARGTRSRWRCSTSPSSGLRLAPSPGWHPPVLRTSRAGRTRGSPTASGSARCSQTPASSHTKPVTTSACRTSTTAMTPSLTPISTIRWESSGSSQLASNRTRS